MRRRSFSLFLALAASSTMAVGAEKKTGKTGDNSLEMRWFFHGELPEDVDRWFESNSRFGAPLTAGDHDKRTDTYLLAVGDETVGLKVRSGELELKQRLSTNDVSFQGGRMSGRAEVWGKWEWSIGGSAAGNKSKGLRRMVAKDRVQREFSQAGCRAEVTSLNVAGDSWWTIAVEPIPPAGDTNKIQSCADWVFQDYPGPLPQTADSWSYPAWLLHLGR